MTWGKLVMGIVEYLKIHRDFIWNFMGIVLK